MKAFTGLTAAVLRYVYEISRPILLFLNPIRNSSAKLFDRHKNILMKTILTSSS